MLEALTRALEESNQAGLYAGRRAGTAAEMSELLRVARKYAWSTIDEVAIALEKAGADGAQRLREAAVDRGRSYAAIRSLAESADIWLDASLNRAEARMQDDAPEEGRALVGLLEDLDQQIHELADGSA